MPQGEGWSGGLTGFQLVNHAPNAVGLAALDDLERGGAVKGGVRVFEPGANGFRESLLCANLSFARHSRPDESAKTA